MKAVVIEKFNEPFRFADIDRPVPAAGEVLVRIKASGVNPLDLKIRTGMAGHAKTETPAILGIDMAGIVETVGPGVVDFQPGDKVFGMTGGVGGVQGSLAEFASVDARLLAVMPASMSFRQAASLPLITITAWEGLIDQANVKPNQKVLIHGGAGGVGHIGIQLAKARGATVFATGSSASFGVIERLGAVPIDYKTETVEQYVQAHTGGKGFDVILDTVGGSTLDASFASVKRYKGHVVSILGWGSHSLAPLSFRAGTYSGVFTLLPLLTGIGRSHHGEILRQAADLYEKGKLMPIVDERTFTLAQIEEAYAAMENGSARGKIVINV